MNYLNAPVGLNALEEAILQQLPNQAVQTGLIVGAGDGRLARALKQKMGNGTRLHLCEPKESLHRYLQEFSSIHTDPWDVAHYKTIADKEKGFDFIYFANMHEYWQGQVDSLQQILELLKAQGFGWTSFYNSSSLDAINRNMPPFTIGSEQLADPYKNWAKIDLTSMMVYLTDNGLNVNKVWGLLEQQAMDYGKGAKTPKETTWRAKGFSVAIKDVGDAFIFGASVVCLHFKPLQTEQETLEPAFLGVLATPSLLQAILHPFAEIADAQKIRFKAHLGICDHIAFPEKKPSVLINFFLENIGSLESVKRILVVGCAWGADLLTLKKYNSHWEVHGIETDSELVTRGKQLADKAGVHIQVLDPHRPLPFENKYFDYVFSLQYFSHIYYPWAQVLAKEMLRVSSKGIAHLEEAHGPELSFDLKSYSIPLIYENLNKKTEIIPINANGEFSGYYIIKIES